MGHTRSVIVAMMLAMTLTGCATMVRTRVAQLAQDIDQRKANGEFPTWTVAVTVLDQEAREIYRRYGIKPDVYSEAQLLVRYYLAEEVDAHRLSKAEARRLLNYMDAYIDAQRQEAQYREQLADAASLSAFANVLSTLPQYRAPTLRSPIICNRFGTLTTCQ